MNQTKALQPAWITPAEAARRAEVNHATVIRWARERGLGWKVAGRFRIDPAALDRLLAGEPAAARVSR